MDTSLNSASPAAPSAGPSWQDNLLDVLRARERMWFVAAILLILLGALLALLAPGTLPPTLVVGAAVGLAAVLLATALVIGLDASDLIVRGERHVAAAGGVVAGHISRSTSDIAALVDLIDAHAAEGGKVRVALTPASRSAGVPGARANIVAAELASRGDKVLVTDLTRGGTPAVGLSDVISKDRKLADAVRFDEELYLAHLAVGSEPELALEGFADWAHGLPPDLDVLVAALPPLSEPGVLPSVQGVELVLLLVEVDRTERVDLIASLDAIDAAGVPAELILVDATTAALHDSASPTVEVLSTPGSAPRQQDPSAFELQDDPAGVRTVPAPTGGPDRPVTTDDPDGSPDIVTDGATGAGAAAGAAAGGDRESEPDESSGDGADERPDTPVLDLDDDEDFDMDDRPVMDPGAGHVRTMRRRGGSAPEETAAMPPVGPEQPVGPARPAEADVVSAEAQSEDEAEPEPAPSGVESEDDAPGRSTTASAVPEDAEPDQSRPDAEPDTGDDQDPIDLVAREQARLSASLQQMADDVWQRGQD